MFRIAVFVVIGLAVGCGAPSAAPSALDDPDRRLIYARDGGVFESAVLFKPAPPVEGRPDVDLAPLLMLETGPGEGPARESVRVVYVHAGGTRIDGEYHEQRTYLWRRGHAAGAQGIRVTFGRDGFPALYEVLADSSGARLLFVAEALEAAAARKFGDPFEGRRFAIERAVHETPDVVVAGTVQPGPVPLGPFFYLARGSQDVTAVVCRCSASRVEAVEESLEYELRPGGELDPKSLALPGWLEETPSPVDVLRWPAGAL